MFVNLVWPLKLTNILPCCVFLIQIIDGKCIFSHSLAKLANMVQDNKVDKHTPGGARLFAASKEILRCLKKPVCLYK